MWIIFLIISNIKQLKKNLKLKQTSTFEVKEIGEARFELGMHFTKAREQGMLQVGQELFISNMIHRLKMDYF